jgi:hypothetical protein
VADEVGKIIKMTDDELRFYALSGDVGSYVHQIGQTEMNMRCALRIAAAAEAMATANEALVEATNNVVEGHHGLIRETRYLVRATWGIVAITFVTQAALIVSELVRK